MAFRIAWFATSVFSCNSVPHIGPRLLTARWASILALSNVCPVCAEQNTHRAHATSNASGTAAGTGVRGAATANTHLDEDDGIAHELEANRAVERGRAFLLIALRYSLLHHGARVSLCVRFLDFSKVL